MYDSVIFTCPKCSNPIEAQSKAGDCHLHDYPSSAVPIKIAKDVEGDAVWCEHCNESYIAIIPSAPETVMMVLVKTEGQR